MTLPTLLFGNELPACSPTEAYFFVKKQLAGTFTVTENKSVKYKLMNKYDAIAYAHALVGDQVTMTYEKQNLSLQPFFFFFNTFQSHSAIFFHTLNIGL